MLAGWFHPNNVNNKTQELVVKGRGWWWRWEEGEIDDGGSRQPAGSGHSTAINRNVQGFPKFYSLQRSAYSAQCKVILYCLHYTVYTIKCKLYSVHYTLYTIQCKVSSLQCTL